MRIISLLPKELLRLFAGQIVDCKKCALAFYGILDGELQSRFFTLSTISSSVALEFTISKSLLASASLPA